MVVLAALLCVSLVGALPLEEDGEECGKEVSDLVLHRDPWLVHLEYKRGDRPLRLRCAGVLVHARYVLTAAHCIISSRLTGFRLKVRLGEYDLINKTDCAESKRGLVCAPPPLSVPAVEAVVHAAYDAGALAHDLALLRLLHAVPTTDFIRSVCLPEIVMHLGRHSILHSTGWGQLVDRLHSRGYAHIKKNVTLPVWEMADCRTTYGTLHLPDAIICAGGEGADTCRGDSGGPLTLRVGKGSRSILLGITAAGYRSCGTVGYPGLYTRIVDYLPWIRRILTRTPSSMPLPTSASELSSSFEIIYVP